MSAWHVGSETRLLGAKFADWFGASAACQIDKAAGIGCPRFLRRALFRDECCQNCGGVNAPVCTDKGSGYVDGLRDMRLVQHLINIAF